MPWRDLWFSSLMGMRGLSLATLSAPDVCRHTTRLLFACRVDGRHRGSHSGIVGLDPGLHAFRRFHIKARLLSHQDKGLGHAKVGWLAASPAPGVGRPVASSVRASAWLVATGRRALKSAKMHVILA
jgi:hypothetical protein